jgi:hypothetical protein
MSYPFGVLNALIFAAREGKSDAYSYLLQEVLLHLGAPAPRGVFVRQLDPAPKGRGRPVAQRYSALFLWLQGVSLAKIAEFLYPHESPETGKANVRSLINSAKKDWKREMLARNATEFDDELAKVGAAIVSDRLRAENARRQPKAAEATKARRNKK